MAMFDWLLVRVTSFAGVALRAWVWHVSRLVVADGFEVGAVGVVDECPVVVGVVFRVDRWFVAGVAPAAIAAA